MYLEKIGKRHFRVMLNIDPEVPTMIASIHRTLADINRPWFVIYNGRLSPNRFNSKSAALANIIAIVRSEHRELNLVEIISLNN